MLVVYNVTTSTGVPRIDSERSSIFPRSISDAEGGILRITGLATEVAQINSKVLRFLGSDLVKFVISLKNKYISFSDQMQVKFIPVIVL